MNAEGLLDELRKLADEAGPDKAQSIQNYIAENRSQALSLSCLPVGQVEGYHGQIGGKPLLPKAFPWPKDRSGAPMTFIAQFDLGRLPKVVACPDKGLLTIFRSPQILTMPVKEGRNFHFSYLPDAGLEQLQSAHVGAAELDETNPANCGVLPARHVVASPALTVSESFGDMQASLGLTDAIAARYKNWAVGFNAGNCAVNRLFGADPAGLEEEKEICAFAASGITHSRERARDHHYSHLMEEVPNWILLGRFDETALFGRREDKRSVGESRLLIRKDDLKQGLFERGWMICKASAQDGKFF